MNDWRPTLGAVPDGDGARVRVWAPGAARVEVVIERGAAGRRHALARAGDGHHEGRVPGLSTGDRYRLAADGGPAWPDPASRFQPEGVHGPSEVVDPGAYRWSDAGWAGVPMERVVLYELHVGTFTPEGTFRAAAARLPALRDLGVTAVELMPVADFPGGRNWGYDGAALFAPARCYGRPDDLRAFVDEAHRLGLAVHLDVVYNHFGPDGAYAAAFSRGFFSERHRSPWGAGINLDGPGSEAVRGFFVENALHWIHEYHVDGLRLDATHAMVDDGAEHFLAELSRRVRATLRGREVALVAEDARNLARMITPAVRGGWDMDGVWADDFHHAVRVLLAGDRDGYFVDYEGTSAEIAAALRQGWIYCGAHSRYAGAPRGTDPRGLPPERFVLCLQNHDQVGNRAFGDRLHHAVPPPAWHAASALLLCAPQTPLLFMGQEWAASTPFRFFTEHGPELGRLVTEGRREEFRSFAAFADAATRARIPDPQAEATFASSRLEWAERDAPPHAGTLRLYRELLAMRRDDAALRPGAPRAWDAGAPDAGTVWLRRGGEDGPGLCVVARLSEAGEVALADVALPRNARDWRAAWTSEDARFVADPAPPRIESAGDALRVRFARPGAVILRRGGEPA